MDVSLRKNIAARDAALEKTGRITRYAAAAAAAGSLVLMAGFANLIPTPHLTSNNGNTSSTGTSTGTGGGAPSSGSGPSQVTSGGS